MNAPKNEIQNRGQIDVRMCDCGQKPKKVNGNAAFQKRICQSAAHPEGKK
jgi:hypothetical protein